MLKLYSYPPSTCSQTAACTVDNTAGRARLTCVCMCVFDVCVVHVCVVGYFYKGIRQQGSAVYVGMVLICTSK